MKEKDLKNSILKAFSRAGVCFSMSILFTGIICCFLNESIPPVIIVKMWITFFILGIITIFRIMADSSKWALSKPFYVKNIVFMPFYLIVSIFFAMSVVESEDMISRTLIFIFYAALFLVAFTITQVISYFIIKAKTDKMNDALIEFQKEHSWDEEE